MPRCPPPSTAAVDPHTRVHTHAYTICNVPHGCRFTSRHARVPAHVPDDTLLSLLLQSTTSSNRDADTDRNRVARALRYGSMCGLRRAASTAATRAPDTRVGVARRGG